MLRSVPWGLWVLDNPSLAYRFFKVRRNWTDQTCRKLNTAYVRRRTKDPALAELNPKQKLAVLMQEDRTLVVAGAGTGKTRTLVAKAYDTVRSGIASPAQIAFVTFTRPAAEEIRARCQDLEGIEIGTLHHLARRVIELVEGKRPELTHLAEYKIGRLRKIQEWLEEAVAKNPLLQLDLEIRKYSIARARNPSDNSRLPYLPVPPDDVPVKSIGEAQVALTLHRAGIRYKYEAEFPVPDRFTDHTRGRQYHPDFYLPDNPDENPTAHGGIWFEHFAHDKDGGLNPEWDAKSRREYKRVRKWKENLHEEERTRFAFTSYGDLQLCYETGKSFPELVLSRIKDQGKSEFKVPSQWDVRMECESIVGRERSAEFWPVTDEIDAWIRTYRQQTHRPSTIWDDETAAEALALDRLAMPVLRRYEEYLRATKTTDFEGMILTAWKYAIDQRVSLPWKVLLVDEYQDVNPAQAAFVHALLKPAKGRSREGGGRLTAVGDDWQAIFGFQGGRVQHIRTFDDPSGEPAGKHERVVLTQTYRFGQQLADTSRAFVTQDKDAIDREVIGAPGRKPHSQWPASVVIASTRLTQRGKRKFGAEHTGLTGAVLAVLYRIDSQAPKNGRGVLIVARRNADLAKPQSNGQKGIGIDRATIERAAVQRSLNIEFSTVHKAKGRESDYVILLDAGPPQAGERAANKALDRALRPFKARESKRAEDRRIWYVALTRAKRKVYLLVSAESESHDEFSDELLYNHQGRYDVGEDEVAEFLEPIRPPIPCPRCITEDEDSKAILALRNGRNGRFAACNSFSAGQEFRCGHTERLCGVCKNGLMARLDSGWTCCQNPECRHQAPLCGCHVSCPMLERRNSRTDQPFWGCQRFPNGCKKIRPWHAKPTRTVAW